MKNKSSRYGVKFATNKGECFYCGEELFDSNRTKDHVIPKSKNGILSNDNKVWCCIKCNKLKADLTPEEFHEVLSFLMRRLKSDYQTTMNYYDNIFKRIDVIVKYKKASGVK